ncbi:MAG: M50 family metallopeptidase [Bryobacterales bacterium]|nr:M50 family metallopeptidase [Bryobacterales bacterium]
MESNVQRPRDSQPGGIPVESRMPGTLSVGQFFGIPLRFHFTFVLLFAFLITISLAGAQSWVGNTIFIAAIFASVFVHEMGHALVSRRYGIRTLEIVMFPIGGIARLEKNPGIREEFWIAIAGPAVNFVIAAGLFAYLAGAGQWQSISGMAEATDLNMLQRIAVGNLVLGLFNLLPALPMDGGRILRSLLARYRPEAEATQLAARIGTGMAALMGLAGLVTFNIFLLFIAFFVYLGASQERAMSIGKSAMQGMPARSAMITEFQTLNHGDTLRDAAAALLASAQQDFPIMLGSRVIGLLGRARLLRALAQDGPDAYISAHMDRDFVRIDPETDLAEAMPRVAAAGSAALVMKEDELLGMLTMENLTEFILLRQMGLRPEPKTS